MKKYSYQYNYQEPENNINKIILAFCFVLIIFLFLLLIHLNNANSNIDIQHLNNVDMKPFEEPIQGFCDRRNNVTIKKINRGSEVDIIPQSTYKIYGRVFTKHHVPAHIELGEIMPYDMVIAWGKMAEPQMYKMAKFEYEFYDRYVWWTFNKEVLDKAEELSECFSNNHIIPANNVIRKGLDKIKVKDIVYMEGFLVNLEVHNDGPHIKMDTSLWRDDDGEGACEILYVTKLITKHGEYN